MSKIDTIQTRHNSETKTRRGREQGKSRADDKTRETRRERQGRRKQRKDRTHHVASAATAQYSYNTTMFMMFGHDCQICLLYIDNQLFRRLFCVCTRTCLFCKRLWIFRVGFIKVHGHALHRALFVLYSLVLSFRILSVCLCLNVSVCLCVFRAIDTWRKPKSGCVSCTSICVCRCTCICLCSVLCMCVLCVVCVCVCLCRVPFLGSVGKVRGKLHPKLNKCLRQPTRTAKQRILKRDTRAGNFWCRN